MDDDDESLIACRPEHGRWQELEMEKNGEEQGNGGGGKALELVLHQPSEKDVRRLV